ncbi:hypothetical protein [Moorena producens]|uniref:hypothetical protein n=1 Tax=Moorena producens TaxID=1155739 RepID=UPI0011EA6169|nr:hypothetical protein [Moorena producens]
MLFKSTNLNYYSVSHTFEVHIIFFLFPIPYSLLPAPCSLKPRDLYLMGIILAITLFCHSPESMSNK